MILTIHQKSSNVLWRGFITLFLTSLFLLLAPTAHADITTGLVGHWKFDEGSGTTAGDSSGNNNTGTLTNGPTWTTGKIGSGALELHASNDYVNLGSNSSIDNIFAGGGTISVWVLQKTVTVDARIVAKDPNTNPSWHFRLNDSAAATQRFDFCHSFNGDGSQGCWLVDAGGDIDQNVWYHAVVVYNKDSDTNDAVFYINGAVVASSETITPPASGTADDDDTSSLWFGARNPAGVRDLDGYLDDVRVYNRALSGADVQELYNATSGGAPPPPPTTSTLTTVKAGTGAGTVSGTGINCGSDCSEVINAGSSVTLTASPTTGSTFAGWSSGGCLGTGNCTVTLNANTPVTATFNTSSTPPPSDGTTVSTASELSAALNNATGGETIYLNPGNYGALNLNSRTFSSMVTLKSANTSNPAMLSTMSLNNVSNLTVDGISFLNTIPTLRYAFIVRNSNDITFQNSSFIGSYLAWNSSIVSVGFQAENTTNITLTNSVVTGFWKGIRFVSCNGVTLSYNDIYQIAEDGINLVDKTHNAYVGHNHVRDFAKNGGGHRDSIQAFSTTNGQVMTNITIDSNFFDAGTGNWTQSVFLGGVMFENLQITNNLIYNAHTNGIAVNVTNGLLIDHNTLLWNDGTTLEGNNGEGYPQIRPNAGSTNVTITNNIVPSTHGYASSGFGTVSNNLVLSRDQYDAYYVGNPYSGAPVALADLQPVPGGLIEQLGVGSSIAGGSSGGSTNPPPPPPSSYTLTVVKAGTGVGTVSGTGISCGSDCSEVVNPGTNITLTASPASGSTFAGWSGGDCSGTSSSCTVTLNRNTFVTADFSQPPASPFNIGDRIGLASAKNVRTQGIISTATLLGTQPAGAQGNLVAGPTQSSANIYTWWDVDYDTGVDGWTGEDNMVLVSSAQSPPLPSTTFTTNDTIVVDTGGGNLNVRATAGGTLLGTQPNNSTGTVTSGPTYANNLWWWNINFTSGTDGWAAESFLSTYTPPPPAEEPAPPPPSGGGGGSPAPSGGGGGGGTTSGGGGGSPSTSSGSSSGGGGFVSTPTLSTGSTGSPQAGSGQATPTTQTPEDTQQLLALIEQLRYLIALLKSLGGTVDPALEAMVNSFPTPSSSSGQATSYSLAGQAFTRNLTVGSRGEDVRQLQILLNNNGFTVSQARGGSPGNETTYFGTKTRAAVAAFQRAHSITPPAGYFGPKTRAAIKAMGL